MRSLLLRLTVKLMDLIQGQSVCERVRLGYKCHKDDPAYNFRCEVCGRYGKGYDPDVVDRDA